MEAKSHTHLQNEWHKQMTGVKNTLPLQFYLKHSSVLQGSLQFERHVKPITVHHLHPWMEAQAGDDEAPHAAALIT